MQSTHCEHGKLKDMKLTRYGEEGSLRASSPGRSGGGARKEGELAVTSLFLFSLPHCRTPGNPGKISRRLGIGTIMPEIKRKNGKSGTYLRCGQALVNNDL